MHGIERQFPEAYDVFEQGGVCISDELVPSGSLGTAPGRPTEGRGMAHPWVDRPSLEAYGVWSRRVVSAMSR
jgi:hypothetical protein